MCFVFRNSYMCLHGSKYFEPAGSASWGAPSWHSGCGHLRHAECSGEPRRPRGMLGRGTDELVPRVREGLRTWFGFGLGLRLGLGLGIGLG